MKQDNKALVIDKDSIKKVTGIEFDSKKNYILFDFITKDNQKLKFVIKLTDFKKWFNKMIKANKVTQLLFHGFLKEYFKTSSEHNINEIIDDTNEIMPDKDTPSNATNAMVGGEDQTMDLEKIFKRSMPKSVRNYSGNLGLGTVVW